VRVDATSIPDPPGYSELSTTEQVRYIQMLWDRVFERPEELPVPESHLQLAEERLESYLRDPSHARSAYDIIDELSDQTT
jgi:putative addiction module component (TIGR02574 family)